jgi:hypothetical protein
MAQNNHTAGLKNCKSQYDQDVKSCNEVYPPGTPDPHGVRADPNGDCLKDASTAHGNCRRKELGARITISTTASGITFGFEKK